MVRARRPARSAHTELPDDEHVASAIANARADGAGHGGVRVDLVDGHPNTAASSPLGASHVPDRVGRKG